jgi:hypothetical protein
MPQQQAALLSYVDVFHIMGILFLAIIPLIVFMRRTGSTSSIWTCPTVGLLDR